MRDKSVFDLASIDAQKLATSYGLLNAPQLTIVTKEKSTRKEATATEANTEGTDKKTEKQDRITKLRQEAKARKLQKL